MHLVFMQCFTTEQIFNDLSNLLLFLQDRTNTRTYLAKLKKGIINNDTSISSISILKNASNYQRGYCFPNT